MRKRLSATILCSGLLLAASTLNGGEPLRIRVSPPVALAPGFLTVRVTIEAAAENRGLEVVAESADYYRSSEVQLEGERTSHLKVFEFRNLPAGLYYATGVLRGTHGPRAMASGLAKVQPSPGN